MARALQLNYDLSAKMRSSPKEAAGLGPIWVHIVEAVASGDRDMLKGDPPQCKLDEFPLGKLPEFVKLVPDPPAFEKKVRTFVASALATAEDAKSGKRERYLRAVSSLKDVMFPSPTAAPEEARLDWGEAVNGRYTLMHKALAKRKMQPQQMSDDERELYYQFRIASHLAGVNPKFEGPKFLTREQWTQFAADRTRKGGLTDTDWQLAQMFSTFDPPRQEQYCNALHGLNQFITSLPNPPIE